MLVCLPKAARLKHSASHHSSLIRRVASGREFCAQTYTLLAGQTFYRQVINLDLACAKAASSIRSAASRADWRPAEPVAGDTRTNTNSGAHVNRAAANLLGQDFRLRKRLARAHAQMRRDNFAPCERALRRNRAEATPAGSAQRQPPTSHGRRPCKLSGPDH